MSITYKIIDGDTFDSISRKQYGSEDFVSLIRSANPGLEDSLIVGTTITIPDQPDAPIDRVPEIPSDNISEAALKIEGERFRFWETISIERRIDSFDIIEFSAPFDSELPSFRQLFEPFSFKTADFSINGDLLFTGRLVNVDPIVDNNQKIIAVSGYSLPGMLNDCTAPASLFPNTEFTGQKLEEISQTLINPFGLLQEFNADPGAVFERVYLEPGKTILSFLSEIARQRNLIISNTPEGRLLYTKSIESGQPVAIFEQGRSPLLSVVPNFSPQNYFSHITGIEPTIVGIQGQKYTVKNDFLNGVVRPFTFSVPDTLDADVKLAVEAKTGRMFGNMVSYEIEVNTWFDSNGDAWKPNAILRLTAPDAMIYEPYDFLIKSVGLAKDSDTETAFLELVLPGSFNGTIPDKLPWAA